MNSFVFNGFKERFLNSEVPSSFNAVFLPMNNKFINNFSKYGFSVEQFRTTDDLEGFCAAHEYKPAATLLDDSKLKYVGIENQWRPITETEEQTKPMYINSENWDAFTASEYWADAKNNKYITGDNSTTYTANGGGFYILRTKEEFNWFAHEVNEEKNNGITGVLFDDVSDKISFTIGKDETIPFQGVLDGNGHILKNAFYVCTGSDNGLVSVLGAKGIIRNFILSNVFGTDTSKTTPTLKGRKQINLNYLKNDARDVNAGLLCGRNYGTIENVMLFTINEAKPNDNNVYDFDFSFSGFVPQVYSVTNKSDDVSDFTSVRKKFDNGENFYFLNSWCINSPGNICPYVGYFAEGIFAQRALGYDLTKATPGPSCIEYSPKMKSYYDTGSEELTIDIDKDSTAEDKPTCVLLAIFMKYDWCNDYLFSHNEGEGVGANSLEYIETVKVKDGDEEKEEKSTVYYDNIKYREYSVKDNAKNDYDGMTSKELNIIRSDPAWYSFNDDPRGRNAIAIVRCTYKNKVYFLELNGMYTSDGAGDDDQTNRFCAGSIDFTQLPSPIIDSDPSEDEKKFYAKIGHVGNKNYWISKGYVVHKNKFARATGIDDDDHGADYEEEMPNKFFPLDMTDSIRVFDEDGNQIKINSCEGFSFRWWGERSTDGDNGEFCDNGNREILTNVVFKTDININLNSTASEKLGCNLRFASKILNPYKMDRPDNSTHSSKFDATNFKKMFDWTLWGNANPSEHQSFYANMYTVHNNLFGKYGKKNRKYLQVNAYKQFIAGNFLSETTFDDKGDVSSFIGITALFLVLENFNKDDGYQRNYIKWMFEKVDKNGKHARLTDDDIKDGKVVKAIYDELVENLPKYVKHEVDYTNVSYAANRPIPQGGDHASGRISRHFLFSTNAWTPDSDFNQLLKYLSKRDYQYLMQEKSNNNFYSKPIDFSYIDKDVDNWTKYYGAIASPVKVCFDFYGNQKLYGADCSITHQTGVLVLETFNYNKFQYSPFVSCCTANGNDGNKDDGKKFDAGAPYEQLISACGVGGKHEEWIYRAANMYAKNPVYYGLDYNGHWTSMAVRTTDLINEDINQVNYNWNIMRAMYEGVPEDPEEPEEKLLWDGIYYDDKVYPDNSGKWYYYEWDADPTQTSGDEYKDQYSDASMIPNSMLNKPIRMHNMVRAAYNVGVLVGANYGTVSSVSGKIKIHNSPDANFVGFLGGIAGKNVNGNINSVSLRITYELNDSDEHYVKYKNTPIMPYSVTKNMNIPVDPDSLDVSSYLYTPRDAYVTQSDINNYSALLNNAKCITFYNPNTYKTNNPDYKEDKDYYDKVKYLSYFTSAWYDVNEQGNGEMTDDVIQYRLKPIFVIGGIAGKVVASHAYNSAGVIKKTNIHDTSVYINNDKPFNADNVDIHSTYGSIIGQIDIQTTDTDYNKSATLINLSTVGIYNYAGDKHKSNYPMIGYVEYQPNEINTVVALRNCPREDKNDYSGPYQNVLYAIDIPIKFDTDENDEKYNYDDYSYANINQSTAAFMVGGGSDGVITEASAALKKIIGCSAIFAGDKSDNFKYDPVDYLDGYFGRQSINSVLGSNTTFVPAIYPFTDTTKPIYKLWKDLGGASISKQEVLYDGSMNNVTRYYFRNTASANLTAQNKNAKEKFDLKLYTNVFSNAGGGDKYYSYTYSTKIIDDTEKQFSNLSADMFNNIQVNFSTITNKSTDLIDITDNYYIANFTDQGGIEGDGVNYSNKNYLVFGKSYSPIEIRKQMNKNSPSRTFTSYLFSAYQNVFDDNGNLVMDEDDPTKTKKVEATNDYQLGGFLVIEKTPGSPSTATGGNLVMFVNNDNGAEIDGRSYNLAFPTTTSAEEVIFDKDTPISDENGKPVTSVFYNRQITGGVLLHVKGKS